MTRHAPAEVRFWHYVNKTDTCWLWTGGKNQAGYGNFRVNDMVAAHRFSWEIHRGNIPDGVFVLHRCDIRHCVNPDHLFLGSKLENAQDRDAKGRGFVTIPDAIVAKIREDHQRGYGNREIARAYGLSHAHVGQIILGKARR